jgi:division protein CdvB (Snf7/Vps24/ESCRT-III family)
MIGKFDAHFSDLDVQTSDVEDAMGSMMVVSTPQGQVDTLMHQMLKEANIELQQDRASEEVPSSASGKLLCIFVEETARKKFHVCLVLIIMQS